MIIYRITGADRTTGAERTIVLEAENERQAIAAAAKQHNLLVSQVRVVPPPKVKVAPPTEHVGALEYRGAIEPAPPAQSVSTPVAPAEPVQTAIGAPAGRGRPIPIPSYVALAIVSIALRIIGVLAIGIAVLIGLLAFANASSGVRAGPADVLVLLSTVAAPVMGGLLLLGVGELLSCVRDMAMNSFRIVNAQR